MGPMRLPRVHPRIVATGALQAGPLVRAGSQELVCIIPGTRRGRWRTVRSSRRAVLLLGWQRAKGLHSRGEGRLQLRKGLRKRHHCEMGTENVYKNHTLLAVADSSSAGFASKSAFRASIPARYCAHASSSSFLILDTLSPCIFS